MRNFDFTPLYRATVGFDRLADLMDRTLTAQLAQPGFPPYNIEKKSDEAYRISIAVAGFAPDDLSVEVKDATLYVTAVT
jgi:molecular chaperone IbpA